MRGCCDACCSNGGHKWKVGCEEMVSLNYRTHQICPSPRCLSRMWLPFLPVLTAAPSRGSMVNFSG